MSQQHLHIIGDSFVDLLAYLQDDWPTVGGDSRLLRPIEVQAGGSSNNTATQLRALRSEVPVTVHTVWNPNDEHGKLLEDHAQTHGYTLVQCPSSPALATGQCLCIVAHGERSFMTHLGCVGDFQAEHVTMESMVSHVHIAGYYNIPGFWDGRLGCKLQELKEQHPSVVLSLVPQHDESGVWDGGLAELYPLLDLLFVNEVEADHLSGGASNGTVEDKLAVWMSFFRDYHQLTVVVTLGSNGAVALSGGAVVARVSPAPSVDVVDPTGAGDAFIAGFLHGWWLTPTTLQSALAWGCAVGSASVTVRGASTVPPRSTVEQLRQTMDGG